MAWAKVDDQWWAHPKVLGLSLAARGLWVTSLSWSCAQRKDVVPADLARMVSDEGEMEGLAGELVTAGLWVVVDRGWRIHEWAAYQERTLTEKRSDAGRKGGIRSGQVRSKPEAPDQHEGNQDGSKDEVLDEANDEAGSLPSPPLPIPSIEHLAPKPARDEVWDTLADLFGEPTTTSNRTLRGRVVKSLANAGANDESIRLRCRAWPHHFEVTLTETALEKHWDRLGRPPAKVSKADLAREKRRLALEAL